MKQTHVDLTAAYYRLTGKSYLSLCPVNSGFMNLGVWPAPSLQEAQENLVRRVLSYLSTDNCAVVEGGCGWGGALPIIREKFGNKPYYGFNIARDQIEHIKQTSHSLENGKLILDSMENILNYDLQRGAGFFSIEAVIHIPDKRTLFQRLREAGVREVVLGEIVTNDPMKVLSEPLFYPSLAYLASDAVYRDSFAQSGYNLLTSANISAHVFEGWANHLSELPADQYDGNRRILSQFQKSYRRLVELYEAGTVQYRIYHARTE